MKKPKPLNNRPKLVVIGGGTGSFTLLSEFKRWTDQLTAIVNMADDGGSSGELRDELGVLPPGDIRQCLVALSNYPKARDMFSYRFGGQGKLKGHSVGNIVLSALELQTGSFNEAVAILADFMHITGRVVPVSLEKHTLIMQDGDKIIRGEQKIAGHTIKQPDARVWLEPGAVINPTAKKAIIQADMVVIAPGNLYGSLLPALSVNGMLKSLKKTKAKVVMVTNLVNKPNQTYNWHVLDYLKKIEQYIGPVVDTVIYNSKLPDKNLLARYAEDNELPVLIDEARLQHQGVRFIGANLVADKIFAQDPNDTAIKRTLIRHDAKALRTILEDLLIDKA